MQTLRRLLRRRSARSEHGRYVIEGPRLVVEAIDAGVAVDAVYVPADADDARHPDVVTLVERCERAGVRVQQVADGVIEQVASTQTPQPALAVAPLVERSLHDVLAGLAERPVAPLVLVLHDVADPGNAGTLLRVAEATGAAVVLCGTEAVDVHNPKVVRAAAGSSFRVPTAIERDERVVLDALRAAGIHLVATALDGRDDVDHLDLRGPVALLLGNEAHGLPADVVALVDTTVRIPMLGEVESLNVGVAGAVLAFEAARQRRVAGTGTEPA